MFVCLSLAWILSMSWWSWGNKNIWKHSLILSLYDIDYIAQLPDIKSQVEKAKYLAAKILQQTRAGRSKSSVRGFLSEENKPISSLALTHKQPMKLKKNPHFWEEINENILNFCILEKPPIDGSIHSDSFPFLHLRSIVASLLEFKDIVPGSACNGRKCNQKAASVLKFLHFLQNYLRFCSSSWSYLDAKHPF